MESNPHEIVWPKYELEQPDLFSPLAQLSYPDYSIANGLPTLDWQNGLPLLEGCFDGFPSLECLPEPDQNSCALMDIVPSAKLIQDEVFWDEFYSPLFEPENQNMLLCGGGGGGQITGEESMGNINVIKRYKERRSSSKMLTRSTISSYFYLPITQAAKELNVGLTFLKKRCRELGIRRWPHRKLMSLQTLIKNLHEYEREKGGESEGKVRESIEILERERRMIEEIPDMEMEDQTKRLRQACFKANYKKRRFMGVNNITMDAQSSSSSSSSSGSTASTGLNASTAANVHENDGTSVEDGDLKSICYYDVYTPSLIPTHIIE